MNLERVLHPYQIEQEPPQSHYQQDYNITYLR
jgi:hypothetical protein